MQSQENIMRTTEATEYQGYTIQSKQGYGDNKPGFMVIKGNSNPMPGATWFETEEKAKQGISALILSNATGGNFWDFINLTK